YDDHDIRVALADASLDAPRVDLWERIDEQVIGLSRKRRPFRSGLRSLAAALAILFVGAGMLAIFTLAGDNPDNRARQVDAVPDLLLMQSYDEQTRLGALKAWVPESSDLRTILDNAVSPTIASAAPLVSRDGTLMIYSGWQQEDATWILRLWGIESATLDIRWTTEIVSAPMASDSSWPELYTGMAITDDHVYVTWHGQEAPLPVPIHAYDIETGFETGSWQVGADPDWASRQAGTPWIAASPDGKYLQFVTQLWDDTATTPQPETALVSFALPEMRETQRMILEESVPADERFQPWNSAFTPDGKTLYSINGGYYNDPLRVDFFDPATGAFVDRVDLNFGTAFEISQQTGLSHDGRRLYIFDAVSSRLAVVDLVARQLVTSATVDTSIVGSSDRSLLGRAWDALGSLFVTDAAAKISFWGDMQLSPDGSRLYAIGIDAQSSAPAGVLVIETSGWQVVDHWLADQHPIKLILSGDGSRLYALTTFWSNQGMTGARVFDTATGEEVVANDDFRQVASPYWTYALTDMYTATWGVMPPVVGVDTDDLQPPARAVPYARMDVSVSASTTLAGQSVTVELRYLDPTTGEVVTEGDDDVRFAEPDHVRALVSDRNTNETVQTIVLARSGSGVYRGAAVLPGAGVWSLQVVAETADEPSRFVTLSDAVVVQPALMGDDGRRYMLAVEVADPPVRAEQEALIRVTIVDAETGAPLPEGVDLAGGTPEAMTGSATLEARAVTTADLRPTGHGVYEGSYNFFAPGRWNISANFPQDGIRAGGVPAGLVVVE
ncbi:MAG TPA: hypothetical protein VEX37_09655, partial [Thermomicrobiales bacterium]|nr:hypothetical protein [Thermomicrobiales bacterium]